MPWRVDEAPDRRRDRLAADPGTVYRYNNTNYALLSRVIERATGRAWIDLVREMTAAAGINTWRLGQSLARPSDEARYYEADSWRYTQSVFDSAPGTVSPPERGTREVAAPLLHHGQFEI